MAIEMLTYAALAERLKISPEAARALAKRLRLKRSRSNDGKSLLSVELAEIQHTWTRGRSRLCRQRSRSSRNWRPVTGRTLSGSGTVSTGP